MLSNITKRTISGLVVKENGPALASLVMENFTLSELKPDNVHIKMLMAPINPADINQIEGTYAFVPPKPFTAGNEGVGEVLAVGSEVKSLKKGDWVIPSVAGLGTWRQELVCPATNLLSIPNDIPIEAAATILVNPCTAYRMIEDFVDLKEGDVIIQNGANSAVGRYVIQIAARRNIKTINVVRDRPEFEKLEAELLSLGATVVIKADRVLVPEAQKHIFEVVGGKPKLALNCVGGHAATDLVRCLEHGGTIVTYGGMSKKPVTIPTGLLIFSDFQIRGFWVSAWYKKQHELHLKGDNSLTIKREMMMSELLEMIRSSQLKLPPIRKHSLNDWDTAIKYATSPYTGFKEVFHMEPFEVAEYDVDDMPKRFKRILNPLPKVTKPIAQASSGSFKKEKERDEWEIRPGETFREFNERIKRRTNIEPKNDVGSGKNFKSRISEEFAEVKGLRAKRKEHLKRRDEKRKKRNMDSDDEDVTMEQIRFGETVKAPPIIKAKPRSASKSTLRFNRK